MFENIVREEEIMGRGASLELGAVVAEAPRGLDRRSFLKQGMAMAGGLALGGTFETFLARAARGQQVGADYGPLREVIDPTTGLPLLKLPDGFSYFSFGWTRDSMKGGVSTPSLHDGMDAIPVGENRFVLIRNHEVGGGAAFRAPTYDPRAGGGTTNILFNAATGQVEQIWPSFSGTIRNCAGGGTPWGTWLTCEENFSVPTNPPGTGITRTHGWVFEVPAFGWAAPVPLTDMGWFSHEATAVDPATDIVYETEDTSNNSGFYRFLPNVRQDLRMGGTLQMLAAKGPMGVPAQGLDRPLPIGSTFDVTWVTIPNPSLAGLTGTDLNGNAVFNQGFVQGGSRFYRLEGCWYGNGSIYFDDTGGQAGSHFGQIWEYVPRLEILRLVFSSPSRAILDMPDNLAVSPRSGGLILCEDGALDGQRLQSLTTTGVLSPFAVNNIIIPSSSNPKPLITPGSYTDFEWAGSTFVPGGPDGQWLFANVQTPGVTFAITGPWERGGL